MSARIMSSSLAKTGFVVKIKNSAKMEDEEIILLQKIFKTWMQIKVKKDVNDFVLAGPFLSTDFNLKLKPQKQQQNGIFWTVTKV